jgi:hypothetical protein
MSDVLQDILEENALPIQKAIHDCVDTGADFALLAGIEVLFPCDCALRDYSNNGNKWDKATSIIKDSIDNNAIFAKIKTTLNGAVNTIVTINVVVPHPTFGDILVDSQDIVIDKNNIDRNKTTFLLLYNGTDSEATQYGFEVRIVADAGTVLKDRSILVVT